MNKTKMSKNAYCKIFLFYGIISIYMGLMIREIYFFYPCTIIGIGCFGYGIYLYKRYIKTMIISPLFITILLSISIYLNSQLFVEKTYDFFGIKELAYILISLIFCSIISFFLTGLCNPKVLCIIWGLINIINIAQYYVMKFRGYIFTIKDLNNIKSAMDIKDNFSFAVDIYFIGLIIVTLMIGYIILISNYKHSKVKYKIFYVLISLCLTIIFVLTADYKWLNQKKYPIFGAGPWVNISDTKMSSIVGTYLTIYYDTKFNVLIKPDNYDIDLAKSYIEDKSVSSYDDDNILIIGILSESYADLTRYLQLDIEPDCYEYWNNLKENVIKGYVNVSPFGGMTCNSEFEFLTGNSMYFLPEGSAAFTTYLFPDTPQDSIVSYLNNLGFNTTTYCPFSRELWDADMAYTNLEFKTKIFAKEMGLNSTNIISHPSNYLSDKQLFENLINYIEDHKTSKDFYWVTTQQNHNPYDYEYNGDIKMNNSNSSELNTYLNDIKDTNEAFEYLIDYFKNYDKKVYIVIFGDHYPEILNIDVPYISSDEDESYRLCHQTPYLIWSNQDIGYTEKDTSLNYLANDLFNMANIPLSQVQQCLEDYRKEIPMISAWGYKDKDNNWHKRNDINDILNQYNILEWYRIFDNKN